MPAHPTLSTLANATVAQSVIRHCYPEWHNFPVYCAYNFQCWHRLFGWWGKFKILFWKNVVMLPIRVEGKFYTAYLGVLNRRPACQIWPGNHSCLDALSAEKLKKIQRGMFIWPLGIYFWDVFGPSWPTKKYYHNPWLKYCNRQFDWHLPPPPPKKKKKPCPTIFWLPSPACVYACQL